MPWHFLTPIFRPQTFSHCRIVHHSAIGAKLGRRRIGHTPSLGIDTYRAQLALPNRMPRSSRRSADAQFAVEYRAVLAGILRAVEGFIGMAEEDGDALFAGVAGVA